MPDTVRDQTLARLKELGVEPPSRELPPLDPPPDGRPDGRRLADALLELNGALAIAYGADRDAVAGWLADHDLAAPPAEQDDDQQAVRRHDVEAAHALAWCLGVVDALDSREHVADDLVDHFPNPETGEHEDLVDDLRGRTPRAAKEIHAELDLHYVLHWLSVNHRLAGADAVPPLPDDFVEEWVIERRRHALELALAPEGTGWDDITLDT